MTRNACPTCGSNDPRWRPAVYVDRDVMACTDCWHDQHASGGSIDPTTPHPDDSCLRDHESVQAQYLPGADLSTLEVQAARELETKPRMSLGHLSRLLGVGLRETVATVGSIRRNLL